MATVFGARSYDGLIAYAYFAKGLDVAPVGISSSDVDSTAFSLPRAVGAVTLIIPALDGVATTVKLQLLSPLDMATWGDVFVYDPSDGTSSTAVSALPEAQTTVIPASALGCGVFRLVASAAQTTFSQVAILFDRIK